MSKAASNEQPQPPSGRMINLLDVYGASEQVIPLVSLKEARALNAIGDTSLQKKS